MNPEQIESLKALSALKADGILTEEEFAAEKNKILEDTPPATKPGNHETKNKVPEGASPATRPGNNETWAADRLKQPLSICSIVMAITMFLPWVGKGVLTLSAWELPDVNGSWLLVYLIPIGVGYVLFRIGKGMSVDPRLRVLLGLMPIIVFVIALFNVVNDPLDHYDILLEAMGVGFWLAVVTGIVVAFDARVPQRFRKAGPAE